MSGLITDFVTYSFDIGQDILSQRSQQSRKRYGQFLTPAAVARFMAKQVGPIRSGDRILDPAVGSGVLVCAVIERLIVDAKPLELWFDCYEVDPDLSQAARKSLGLAAERAADLGITLHIQVKTEDFILSGVPTLQPYLFVAESSARSGIYSIYNHIISNPPYFKLGRDDPRVKVTSGQVKGHTNIYSLFLALAVKKLVPQGRACFIVPRSFCSGLYFSSFRQDLIEESLPCSVHLFESRQDNFETDSVLQENIIFSFKRRKKREKTISPSQNLSISISRDASKLENRLLTRQVPLTQFLGSRFGTFFFRLPTGELDEQILETIDSWSGSLKQFGLEVSTGPVVAFRTKSWLSDAEAVSRHQAVPLLWMQNVKRQQVEWPVMNGQKSQGILFTKESLSLLVPATNYVLLRRFSAKEEPRRLIAAPFLAIMCGHQWIGLENHLNYIYKIQGDFETKEAVGLSALLNSALLDRYFRIVNGNTQVNASELRALPLPPMELIKSIGSELLKRQEVELPIDIDGIVFDTLRKAGYLALDFPTIRETRITMGKIQEAQEILRALGLPPNQQNEISALTLLVLAQLSEETPWANAKQQSLRIHDILIEIKKRYEREYAENTRETIRRQVIHQFEQAGLVVRNPDAPTLATNSPRTHYALSPAAIRTICTYQSDDWEQMVQTFIESRGALLEIYQKSREQQKIPLRLASGEEYHLSPGQHNELQVAVAEEFGPRFAPGARLLYLGDTENKTLILDKTGFEKLGIPVPSHDKLPDIVLYDEIRNWLFLIEAVTSHGPVSPKRHFELEKALKRCSAGRVYVSAFPDFGIFKTFLTEIAWETEVWLAEIPDHLIHFNGNRFLGPRADR